MRTLELEPLDVKNCTQGKWYLIVHKKHKSVCVAWLSQNYWNGIVGTLDDWDVYDLPKTCNHEDTTFRGIDSLVGNYVCNQCGEIIEPVEYHRIAGLPHRNLDQEHNVDAFLKVGQLVPAWVYDLPTRSEIAQNQREQKSVFNRT